MRGSTCSPRPPGPAGAQPGAPAWGWLQGALKATLASHLGADPSLPQWGPEPPAQHPHPGPSSSGRCFPPKQAAPCVIWLRSGLSGSPGQLALAQAQARSHPHQMLGSRQAPICSPSPWVQWPSAATGVSPGELRTWLPSVPPRLGTWSWHRAGTTATGIPAPGITTPAYFLGAEPEKEGGGEERGGRVCGSVCGKDFFFFPFFPFFLCKKCTKAGQPLCKAQQCLPSRGGGPRPGAPACHCWWPRIA